MPHTAVPHVAMPWTAMPRTAMPWTAMPHTAMPQTIMPHTSQRCGAQWSGQHGEVVVEPLFVHTKNCITVKILLHRNNGGFVYMNFTTSHGNNIVDAFIYVILLHQRRTEWYDQNDFSGGQHR